jgi:hypothetical protein
MGYQLFATKGTFEKLQTMEELSNTVLVYKPLVKREPNALSLVREGKIDMVVNVPDSMDSQALTDGFEMRRCAVDSAVPLIADIKTAILAVASLKRKFDREKAGKPFFYYQSWQEMTEPAAPNLPTA